MGVHLRCHPGFIAVSVWILMRVVLANTYAAFLLSLLSVEKFELLINSISELAHSTDVQLTVQAHSDRLIDFWFQLLFKSVTFTFSRSNPFLFF